MEAVKKVEIIICEYYLPSLVSLLLESEIVKYNVIPNLTGECGIEMQDDEMLSEEYKNCLVIVVGNYEQFRLLMEPLRELLQKIGGTCMTSDVHRLEL